MSPISNIFKKKKPVRKPKEVKKKLETEKPAEIVTPKKEAKISEAYRILRAPQVTEKSTFLGEKNQYVFKVFPEANKPGIRKAVKELYGVDVLSVRIIKIPRKRRRLGRTSGWRTGYKKAIVKIKAGQKIEILPR